MSRPFTDITKSKSAQPIKNGTLVISVQKTGNYKTNNDTVSSNPTIEIISNKYGSRFYNGIFVQLVGGQSVFSLSSDVTSIQRVTQAEYDAISNPDANTLYIIVG